MGKVKILVDSSADIPSEIAQTLGIGIIPMPVNIGERSYLEGVDLKVESFYNSFKEFAELPKTSQPNLQDVVNFYREAGSGGNSVIAVHLSSGLSGTVQTANLVKDMLKDEVEIAVIDSLGASLGAGMMAINAAEQAAKGVSFDEIITSLEQDRVKMRYIFTLDTLEYLIKGGRVSKVSGMVGTLLDIKPLLHITQQGKIEAYGKVRGRRASLRKLAEQISSEIKHPETQVIGISHSMCLEDAQILAEEIRAKIAIKDILFSTIGCTVGSHTGPGCVALFYRT
ncbi:MAG TPA: DegV family protein [Candidatus Deferrimicrobium sp.]|nr:DegV family protein [Candidatus Deferrimicrobium sp.]